MIRLTGEMLREICPQATDKACELFAPYINEGVKKYGIYDKEVFSAFLAHIIHESGGFKYVREIWGNTSWQVRYERDFKEEWGENLNQEKPQNLRTIQWKKHKPCNVISKFGNKWVLSHKYLCCD